MCRHVSMKFMNEFLCMCNGEMKPSMTTVDALIPFVCMRAAFDENLLWLTVKCHWQAADGWKFLQDQRETEYSKYVHQFLLLKSDLEWSSSYAQIKNILSPTRANNFFLSTLFTKQNSILPGNIDIFVGIY